MIGCYRVFDWVFDWVLEGRDVGRHRPRPPAGEQMPRARRRSSVNHDNKKKTKMVERNKKKYIFFPTKNIQKEKKINVGTKSQPDVKPLFRRQTNRVPPFSSEFYSSWIGFYRVGLINTQLNWFLSSFTGFYWVLLGFTGFYWVLLGFTGFY